MANSSAFIYVFIALIIGVVLGFVIGRGRKSDSAVPNEQVNQTREQLAASQATVSQLSKQIEQLNEQLAKEQASNIQQTELKKELEALKTQVTSLSTTAIDADRRRAEAEKEIQTRIQEMKDNNFELAKNTGAIAKVLSSSQARGRFGEVQLQVLLENAGLLKQENFDTQRVIMSQDESDARPDVTINMPGGTSIFIDSKFPFEDYFNAYTQEDELKRNELLEKHAKVVRSHIKTLADRQYANRSVSPDFVVLFAPIESILSDALKVDPALLEYAFKLNVTIATPSNMLALLHTVGFVFSRESVAKNANEIRELAKEFLANISKLYERIATLGKRLNSTVTAFDDVVKYSEGSLLRPATKISKLDVQGSPIKLPDSIAKDTREYKSIVSSEFGQEIVDVELIDEDED